MRGNLLAAEVAQHPRELQADVREHEALQQQVGREPQGLLLLAGRVVGARGVVADEQAHRDDREHSGPEQVLGDRVGAEGGEQPERADHDRVVHPHPELVQHRPEHESDRDAHAHRKSELSDPAPHRDRRARDDRREHAVQRQRGRVVDEALPRQHGHDAARQTELAADRGGRDRVGRGDDRTEQQRAGQRERGQDPPGDEPDRDRGQQHERDTEPADLRQAALEPHERHVQRGRVQQRRQHEIEQQVAVDVDVGHEGQEGCRERDHRHEQRCRPAPPSRDRRDDHRTDEHIEDLGIHAPQDTARGMRAAVRGLERG